MHLFLFQHSFFILLGMTSITATLICISLFSKSRDGQYLTADRTLLFAVFYGIFQKMINAVLGLGKQFKIFHFVIKSIPIFMMDYFSRMRQQFPAKVLLHYISMLKDKSFINMNALVAVWSYATRTMGSLFWTIKRDAFEISIIMEMAKIFSKNFVVTFFNFTCFFIHGRYFNKDTSDYNDYNDYNAGGMPRIFF